MVCVPCIFIPILLFIWHKFIQPFVLKFWNPWEKKDADGNVKETEFPFTCNGGVCPYPNKNKTIESNKDTVKTEDKPKVE